MALIYFGRNHNLQKVITITFKIIAINFFNYHCHVQKSYQQEYIKLCCGIRVQYQTIITVSDIADSMQQLFNAELEIFELMLQHTNKHAAAGYFC